MQRLAKAHSATYNARHNNNSPLWPLIMAHACRDQNANRERYLFLHVVLRHLKTRVGFVVVSSTIDFLPTFSELYEVLQQFDGNSVRKLGSSRWCCRLPAFVIAKPLLFFNPRNLLYSGYRVVAVTNLAAWAALWSSKFKLVRCTP